MFAALCVLIVPFLRGVVVGRSPNDQNEATDFFINGLLLFATVGLASRAGYWGYSAPAGLEVIAIPFAFLSGLALAHFISRYGSTLGRDVGRRLPPKKPSRWVVTSTPAQAICDTTEDECEREPATPARQLTQEERREFERYLKDLFGDSDLQADERQGR